MQHFIDRVFVQRFIDRVFVQRFVDRVFVQRFIDRVFVIPSPPHIPSLKIFQRHILPLETVSDSHRTVVVLEIRYN